MNIYIYIYINPQIVLSTEIRVRRPRKFKPTKNIPGSMYYVNQFLYKACHTTHERSYYGLFVEQGTLIYQSTMLLNVYMFTRDHKHML